ncbi:alkaline phosphatase family protein [Pedococcus ginsenosidimutans]|uniref:alkaline phosphatase family protein n=1 Tax=Pedococcus ginsenosidimutans TaxID=490570 RepID=UPI0031E81ABA
MTIRGTRRESTRTRRARSVALGVLLASTALVGACTSGTVAYSGTTTGGASSSTSSTSSPGTGTGTGSSTSTGATSAAAGVDKLLVVVVENHSLAQMRAAMPYTYGLALRYGYASHYTAIRHPSLPNYVAIASGSTHGIADDAPPSAHPVPGPSVFGAALAKGRTAAVYVEGMTSPCEHTSSGDYAVKHNPWPYFTAEAAQCARHNLPLSAFDADVRSGHLPNAGMLLPDLCNDAHNCPLATADAWFAERMKLIEAGPDWRAGRLAVVLTADEDDHSAGNQVLTVVAHPSLDHVVVTTPLTHYSLTRLYAEVTGTTPLGSGATAPSMAKAFGLRLR